MVGATRRPSRSTAILGAGELNVYNSYLMTLGGNLRAVRVNRPQCGRRAWLGLPGGHSE